MKLSPNQQTALKLMVQHDGILLYNPDSPHTSARWVFSGNLGTSVVALINRGLVTVVDHQSWHLTPLGHQVAAQL